MRTPAWGQQFRNGSIEMSVWWCRREMGAWRWWCKDGSTAIIATQSFSQSYAQASIPMLPSPHCSPHINLPVLLSNASILMLPSPCCHPHAMTHLLPSPCFHLHAPCCCHDAASLLLPSPLCHPDVAIAMPKHSCCHPHMTTRLLHQNQIHIAIQIRL